MINLPPLSKVVVAASSSSSSAPGSAPASQTSAQQQSLLQGSPAKVAPNLVINPLGTSGVHAHLPPPPQGYRNDAQLYAMQPNAAPNGGGADCSPLPSVVNATNDVTMTNGSSSSAGATPSAASSPPGASNGVAGAQGASPQKPRTAATPEQVLKLYSTKLTPYEQQEIYSYPQIYFIGANAKKRPGIVGSPNNNGYDDEQGSYTHITHDHVAYRYEVLKVIGKGSFGQVVKAYDHKLHQCVALKMVRNEKRFHRQAQEEIKILEHLRKQDKENAMNIVHMTDHFTFRNHQCITFELLSMNLYELIKKNKFQGFSLQLVRKFAHSLLQCLDALYKNKIIHCDMKPENVLLKQQGRSGIKVSYKENFFHFFP